MFAIIKPDPASLCPWHRPRLEGSTRGKEAKGAWDSPKECSSAFLSFFCLLFRNQKYDPCLPRTWPRLPARLGVPYPISGCDEMETTSDFNVLSPCQAVTVQTLASWLRLLLMEFIGVVAQK